MRSLLKAVVVLSLVCGAVSAHALPGWMKIKRPKIGTVHVMNLLGFKNGNLNPELVIQKNTRSRDRLVVNPSSKHVPDFLNDKIDGKNKFWLVVVTHF